MAFFEKERRVHQLKKVAEADDKDKGDILVQHPQQEGQYDKSKKLKNGKSFNLGGVFGGADVESGEVDEQVGYIGGVSGSSAVAQAIMKGILAVENVQEEEEEVSGVNSFDEEGEEEEEVMMERMEEEDEQVFF